VGTKLLRLPDSELPCYSVLGAVIPKPLGGRSIYLTHPWRHREQLPDNSIHVRVRIFGDGYYPPLEERYWEQVMEYPLLVFPYRSQESVSCVVYQRKSEHKYLHVFRLRHRNKLLRYYVDADEQLTSSEIVRVVLKEASFNGFLEGFIRYVAPSECALYDYTLNDMGYAPYDLFLRLGCPVVDGVQQYRQVRRSTGRYETPGIEVYLWVSNGRPTYAHLFGFTADEAAYWKQRGDPPLKTYGRLFERGSGCALLAPVQLTPEQVYDCEAALRSAGDVHVVEGGAE